MLLLIKTDLFIYLWKLIVKLDILFISNILIISCLTIPKIDVPISRRKLCKNLKPQNVSKKRNPQNINKKYFYYFCKIITKPV